MQIPAQKIKLQIKQKILINHKKGFQIVQKKM